MFVRAYLDTAEQILNQYDGSEPLPSLLKKYFGTHKKFGSRDRRQISHLCYCYFRLGHALPQISRQDRMLLGLFLCSTVSQPVLAQLKPEWNDEIGHNIDEKMGRVAAAYDFSPLDIFPFSRQLSPEIEQPLFQHSFLLQPDTYLRVRPGSQQQVRAQLDDAGISYYSCGEQCLGMPPAAKLDELLMLNRDAVVQDKSSQQVLSLLHPLFTERKAAFSAWDCCAASGGKSILLHDLYPNSRLTVSDIRNSILVNLKKRFEQAGIRQYQSFIADVGAADFLYNQQFNLVLCDAPCSGSGTWGRTPEQLYFFTEQKIAHYTQLQQRIAANAAKQVGKGGVLLYITCSVFAAENEAIVARLQQQSGLQLAAMQYFKGYNDRADTLFAAALQRL